VAVDLPCRAPAEASLSAPRQRPDSGIAGPTRSAASSIRRRRRRPLVPEYVNPAAGRGGSEGGGQMVATTASDDRRRPNEGRGPGCRPRHERESFSTPWPGSRISTWNSRTTGLPTTSWRRCGDKLVGFAGMWLLVDEAHVTTFATRRAWRRQGDRERLLLALLDLAGRRWRHPRGHSRGAAGRTCRAPAV